MAKVREKYLAYLPSLEQDSFVHVSKLGESYKVRAYLPGGVIRLLAQATRPAPERRLERLHPSSGAILEIGDKEVPWDDWGHWRDRIADANTSLRSGG